MADFKTQVLVIEGMHCDACVSRVTHALGAVRGARVHNVTEGEARVLAEPNCEQQLRDAVKEAGYEVTRVHVEH